MNEQSPGIGVTYIDGKAFLLVPVEPWLASFILDVAARPARPDETEPPPPQAVP